MENKEFDRISYALGLSMGNNFRASGIQSINVGDFADGVAAVFDGAQPKMSYDEAKTVIREYFTAMEEKQAKRFSLKTASALRSTLPLRDFSTRC